MPATLLSHQAVVLPLKMRWPRQFSGLALCIGSMAPDLEFIGRMDDDWLFSHTVSAQLWFTVPITTLLVWVVSAHVLPALLPYLPDHAWWKPHDLAAIRAPRCWRAWTRVAISAWVGGMSHVLLDAMTHGNHSGWLVPVFPVLRTLVPHIGGDAPLHDALQLWCTIGFAAVTLVLWRQMVRQRSLWRWQQQGSEMVPVVPLARMPRADGVRIVWALAALAMVGAVAGHALRQRESAKAVMAGIAFGAIDFAVAGAIALALGMRTRGRSTMQGAAPLVADSAL
jgi:hypothetical protein